METLEKQLEEEKQKAQAVERQRAAGAGSILSSCSPEELSAECDVSSLSVFGRRSKHLPE